MTNNGSSGDGRPWLSPGVAPWEKRRLRQKWSVVPALMGLILVSGTALATLVGVIVFILAGGRQWR